MTPDRTSGELVELLVDPEMGEEEPDALAKQWASGPREMWRDAEGEARQAYGRWRQNPSVDAYVVYLAAEERAAAVQMALAACSRASSAWI